MTLQTATQRLKDRNYLIQRDGPNCLYCKERLDFDKDVIEVDHLDCNHHNNAEWNKVLCHSKCNKEKKINSDYQIIAFEKSKENQRRIFTPKVEDKSANDASPEIDHNVNTKNLIKQKLSEIINTDGRIEYKDVLNGLTYFISEKLGHCSQITIRRHLDAVTSSFPGFEAPFMTVKEGGTKYIVRRSGN